MNNIKKLSLYIRVHDPNGGLEYRVSPSAGLVIQHHDVYEHQILHDTKSRTRLRVQMTKCKNSGSYLVIERLVLDGVELNNMRSWSRYVTDQGRILDTHGHMDQSGTYYLTIRHDALSHNYLAYFLERCDPNAMVL